MRKRNKKKNNNSKNVIMQNYSEMANDSALRMSSRIRVYFTSRSIMHEWRKNFFDYYANAYLCDRFTLCVCLCHRWAQIVVVCFITDKSCDVLHHFPAAFFIFVINSSSSLCKKKVLNFLQKNFKRARDDKNILKVRRWTCSHDV